MVLLFRVERVTEEVNGRVERRPSGEDVRNPGEQGAEVAMVKMRGERCHSFP